MLLLNKIVRYHLNKLRNKELFTRAVVQLKPAVKTAVSVLAKSPLTGRNEERRLLLRPLAVFFCSHLFAPYAPSPRSERLEQATSAGYGATVITMNNKLYSWPICGHLNKL